MSVNTMPWTCIKGVGVETLYTEMAFAIAMRCVKCIASPTGQPSYLHNILHIFVNRHITMLIDASIDIIYITLNRKSVMFGGKHTYRILQ